MSNETIETTALHTPVMLKEAIDGLRIQENHWYIDGTFGRGGHTQAMLAQGANVIAFDHDLDAITYGQQTFATEIQQQRLILTHANFDQLSTTIDKLKPSLLDQQNTSFNGFFAGILFDFGTSVDQLTNQERGFSFTGNGPLDMRMDQRLGVTAADLLALLSEQQLANLFREYGGEESAKAIARAIVKHRTIAPITMTEDLVSIINTVKRRHSALHPATKTFQALRIAVNTELDNIAQALPQAFSQLAPAGRLVTIAFHEGEDRLVKHFNKKIETEKLGNTFPLQFPSEEEIARNPKARSAKLRILEKNTI